MMFLTEQDFRNYDQLIRKNIAQAVYNKRKANGWTRYELAKRCGLEQHSIDRLEDGERFGLHALLRVAKCLGIDILII